MINALILLIFELLLLLLITDDLIVTSPMNILMILKILRKSFKKKNFNNYLFCSIYLTLILAFASHYLPNSCITFSYVFSPPFLPSKRVSHFKVYFSCYSASCRYSLIKSLSCFFFLFLFNFACNKSS